MKNSKIKNHQWPNFVAMIISMLSIVLSIIPNLNTKIFKALPWICYLLIGYGLCKLLQKLISNKSFKWSQLSIFLRQMSIPFIIITASLITLSLFPNPKVEFVNDNRPNVLILYDGSNPDIEEVHKRVRVSSKIFEVAMFDCSAYPVDKTDYPGREKAQIVLDFCSASSIESGQVSYKWEIVDDELFSTDISKWAISCAESQEFYREASTKNYLDLVGIFDILIIDFLSQNGEFDEAIAWINNWQVLNFSCEIKQVLNPLQIYAALNAYENQLGNELLKESFANGECISSEDYTVLVQMTEAWLQIRGLHSVENSSVCENLFERHINGQLEPFLNKSPAFVKSNFAQIILQVANPFDCLKFLNDDSENPVSPDIEIAQLIIKASAVLKTKNELSQPVDKAYTISESCELQRLDLYSEIYLLKNLDNDLKKLLASQHSIKRTIELEAVRVRSQIMRRLGDIGESIAILDALIEKMVKKGQAFSMKFATLELDKAILLNEVNRPHWVPTKTSYKTDSLLNMPSNSLSKQIISLTQHVCSVYDRHLEVCDPKRVSAKIALVKFSQEYKFNDILKKSLDELDNNWSCLPLNSQDEIDVIKIVQPIREFLAAKNDGLDQDEIDKRKAIVDIELSNLYNKVDSESYNFEQRDLHLHLKMFEDFLEDF